MSQFVHARKVRVASLIAETTFDMKTLTSSLPSIDAITHTEALMELERDLLTAKSRLRVFFKTTAKQHPIKTPVVHIIPKIKQKRYGARAGK